MKIQNSEHEQNQKDPVCGMDVSHAAVSEEFKYQDKTYYFCSGACRETFEKEPEKYIH